MDLTLNDFESKNPDDVSVMVAHGQTNQGVMADAGGSNDLFDISIKLDDESPIRASDNNLIGAPGFGITTVVAPARYGADHPAPAPSALSVFDKTNPNGTWELFVVDDGFGGDPATIGGWSLTIKVCRGSGPSSCPYSPECVEGVFCEVRAVACRGPVSAGFRIGGRR